MTLGDMSQLFQQAQKMQRDMKQVQDGLKKRNVMGESGGGMVKVYVNGAQEVLKVEIDPQAAGLAYPLGRVGGGQQGFRGHAAVVQAIAAHLVLLDQHGGHAEPGGHRRHREAAGTGADDADVGVNGLAHPFHLVARGARPPIG